ncbi:MAG: murein hydrolase activator EnvC family protein, partial [Nitrospiria bacterium]
KIDDQLPGLSLKINRLNQDVKKIQAVISKRLSAIYQERQSRALRVLLASQDHSDFLRRLYYLRTIAKKEGALLVRFKEKQSQLDEKNRQLAETQEHLIKNKKSLGEQLTHIRAEKKKKSRLLSRVQSKRASYEEALVELNQASLQLQGVIERLEKNKNSLKKRFSGKFSRKKGQLSWPNDGNVVALFGRQKHPKFDTMIYRKGIEISPSRGDDVRAIFDGVVIFANWFRGYGMVIIIDHGENYYSIYAHLSKLLISVGDRVRKDRMIAEVGGTGFSQGNKLYLEIRHQGKPMDPLTWLRKRG